MADTNVTVAVSAEDLLFEGDLMEDFMMQNDPEKGIVMEITLIKFKDLSEIIVYLGNDDPENPVLVNNIDDAWIFENSEWFLVSYLFCSNHDTILYNGELCTIKKERYYTSDDPDMSKLFVRGIEVEKRIKTHNQY